MARAEPDADQGPHRVTFATAIGPCALTYRNNHIVRLELLAAESSALDCSSAELPGTGGPAIKRVVRRLQRHAEGQPDDLRDVALDLVDKGSFAQRIYHALRDVAPGQTTTYANLARQAGYVGAGRAVGQAMAANPVPLIVPCHRVIKSDGSLGHYSAPTGSELKLRLLTIEGTDLSRVARAAARYLSARDSKMALLVRRHGPHPFDQPAKLDPFTALVQAIVSQQVSVQAGQAIFDRLRALTSKDRGISAKQVTRCPPEELRRAGLSAQKISYIRDLAERCLDSRLDLNGLTRLDDEAAIERLRAIKGVGRWTAQMFLIFSLRRLNVLPLDDLGLRQAAQQHYGLPGRATEQQLRHLARAWRPFSSIAAWYLWRSLSPEVR